MLINPISSHLSVYNKNAITSKNKTAQRINLNTGVDTVSFTSHAPDYVKRNQYKVLLTQDIWAPKLSIKMPENHMEKEVLLEILEQREKLDRFTRLTNKRFEIISKTILLSDMMEADPTNPKIEELKTDLKRHGNIDSTLKTLDKDIEMERKKNQAALDYFKKIEEMEDKYLEKRYVRPGMITKFYEQVKKHNLNKNGQYSTKELIEIVKAGGQPLVEKPKAAQPLSKKQVLAEAKNLYEQSLRENINIYDSKLNHYQDATDAQKVVNDFYASSIKRYPDLHKMLVKTYRTTEATFKHKVERLVDIDIYPIGEIWDDMKGVEDTLKLTMNKMDKLEQELETNPNSTRINTNIQEQQAILNEAKEDWIKGVKYSCKYEEINKQRMIDAGRGGEYEYLTGANLIIRRHKAALKIYTLNNDNIPDNLLKQVIFGKVEDLEKYVAEQEQ